MNNRKNIKLIGFVLFAFFSSIPSNAKTIDQKIKKLGIDSLRVGETTRDQCRKGQKVVITSTIDGAIEIRPGEIKFFRIKKIDDYTKSGGWYWTCNGKKERSRMKGAEYVMAIRSEETGQIDWFRITIDI